ncbi:MAG: YdeI/OmpD-associated family protein [Gemmatimonadaceae bacterium]
MKKSEASTTTLPVKLFKHQKAWDVWLAKNFDSSVGVWLRLAKKSASLQSVSYREAIEVALCHGWIDGQGKSFDDESWLQKFTPRRMRSIWSKINRAKAMALIDDDRMRAGGLAAIERAKENGRWESAYDSHRTAVVPADFQAALTKSRKAKAFFATLNSQNRYAILFRIQTAKKAGTRQKRIDKFVQMLAKHETLHPKVIQLDPGGLMKKKGPRGIPDFSPKPKSVPGKGLPDAKTKPVSQPPVAVVKPQATSAKSGRRGQ